VKILETNTNEEVSGLNVRRRIFHFLLSVNFNISTDSLFEFKYFFYFARLLYKASGFMKLIAMCLLVSVSCRYVRWK